MIAVPTELGQSLLHTLLILHSVFPFKEKPSIIFTKHMPLRVCKKPAGVKEKVNCFQNLLAFFFSLLAK